MDKKLKETINKLKYYHQGKRKEFFTSLDARLQAKSFLLLSSGIQLNLLQKLTNVQITNFLKFLDPDEITDIVQLLAGKKGNKLLELLEEDKKIKVEYLLNFNPKTAAGIMSLDYISADIKTNLKEIFENVEKHESRTGKLPVVLIKEKGALIGELPLYYVGIANSKKIEREQVKYTPSVNFDAPKKEVIEVFKRNPHDKIVVLDSDNSIIGVIYSDDILKIIEKEVEKSIYGFASVSNEEDVLDGFWSKVKNRYAWLILNFFTAILAALVVSLFQDTISTFVFLAIYMPIVAGMGGNAGTQAMAVMVRGLTLGEVSWKNLRKVVYNEFFAGAINGLIVGVLATVVAYFLNANLLLGLILGISMVINLALAGFFGSIIPLILKALGKDPATASSIFITTFTDVFGFLVFLGLASIIL
jgi:magnesium transporter